MTATIIGPCRLRRRIFGAALGALSAFAFVGFLTLIGVALTLGIALMQPALPKALQAISEGCHLAPSGRMWVVLLPALPPQLMHPTRAIWKTGVTL